MYFIKFYQLPVILAVIIILITCGLLSGCYTLKQGAAMLNFLNSAVPLEEVDDDEFVRLVNDIRRFAMEELGLAMSKNYTKYVQIDRNYLAAVVSASAKDSFKRHEWKFPIVGALPYKGFFNDKDAQKERAKLAKKDLDVWIRGVDAFSTLGWFKDPLYSYMRGYPPDKLAELIIHELVHATIFIKGQINFNEELAEFIGSEGARLFIIKYYGQDSKEYNDMLASKTDSQSYVLFVQEVIAELDILYAKNIDREEKLIEKERIILAAKARFDVEYESRFISDNYREAFPDNANNAYFELFRLYHTEDNFYEDLYERSGRNLSAFIAAAKKITRKGDPREQLEKLLL